MKRLIAALIAAMLAMFSSPFLFPIQHKCGLSSWPMEVVVTLLCVGVFFFAVYRCRRVWLIAGLMIAAPFASYYAASKYYDWLHLASFPEVLLDKQGKEWKAMIRWNNSPESMRRLETLLKQQESKEKKPNQPPEPTPTAGMTAAEQQSHQP